MTENIAVSHPSGHGNVVLTFAMRTALTHRYAVKPRTAAALVRRGLVTAVSSNLPGRMNLTLTDAGRAAVDELLAPFAPGARVRNTQTGMLGRVVRASRADDNDGVVLRLDYWREDTYGSVTYLEVVEDEQEQPQEEEQEVSETRATVVVRVDLVVSPGHTPEEDAECLAELVRMGWSGVESITAEVEHVIVSSAPHLAELVVENKRIELVEAVPELETPAAQRDDSESLQEWAEDRFRHGLRVTGDPVDVASRAHWGTAEDPHDPEFWTDAERAAVDRARSVPASSRSSAVVTNLTDLTPTMRETLVGWAREGSVVLARRQTAQALRRRGLVTDAGNGWYRLTDAGKAARARLLSEAGPEVGEDVDRGDRDEGAALYGALARTVPMATNLARYVAQLRQWAGEPDDGNAWELGRRSAFVMVADQLDRDVLRDLGPLLRAEATRRHQEG